MASDIRIGQLIAPFGPGSIYTDKNGIPGIICGLDFWHKQRDERGRWSTSNAALRKHVIAEPRLSELLGVPQFRQPPEYTRDEQTEGVARLGVQTHRFPTWYVDSLSGKLRRFTLGTLKLAPLVPGEKARWRPVRFISVCGHGHLADFPWKEWSGCSCPGNGDLNLNDSGGPDLRSVQVWCKKCRNGKSLAGSMNITLSPQRDQVITSGLGSAKIQCSGERPWLGHAPEPCLDPPVAALINQSNIYFGKTLSSIYLPDMGSDQTIVGIQKVLRRDDMDLTLAKLLLQMDEIPTALVKLKEMLLPYIDPLPDDESIIQALKALSEGPPLSGNTPRPTSAESSALTFRRAEYNVLRNEVGPGVDEELRVIPGQAPDDLKFWFDRVNLVERLRETRVFCGFERLIRQPDPLAGMPNSVMKQLFLSPPDPNSYWLPAVKNYGEGIYIELSESAVQQWLDKNMSWLAGRLDQDFIARLGIEPNLLPPPQVVNQSVSWAARYLLTHTLAHILINQMVFECGYSSAALKERLFVSNDSAAPMAGFLIYTAAGDTEGSLGGLVRLGRAELFEPMVRRAIARASWCSADPVCSENLGGTGSRRTNKAACHACVLLPETACETVNSGLDRAMVVGTPQRPEAGFLVDLVHAVAF